LKRAGIILIVGCLAACEKETSKDASTSTGPAVPVVRADPVNGQAVYVQHCLLCHQQDGGGVPNMQPPLIESKIASGDADHLIELVLRGVGGQSPPAMPASGEYAMVMPSAKTLSDKDIADLLSYIRQTFVEAKPIGAEQVAAVRAKLE